MGKVDRIEQLILELSPAELAQLQESLRVRDWEAWDAQIEADSRAGNLDFLVRSGGNRIPYTMKYNKLIR